MRCTPCGTGVLLLACAFAGCAPAAKSIRERPFPAAEVIRRVQERNEQVRTLRGNGTITVEAPEGSNSGYFDASLKKPDSLLVEFKGPFGIHVATLQLCRDRFVFFNQMENKAIIGKPDGKTLQSMLKLKMEFDEILNVFTGEFPAASPGDSLARFTVEDDRYVLRYAERTDSKEYQIDGEDFVVTSYRVADSAGSPAVTATASRIDDSPPVAVPKLLRVIFPQEKRSITIAYSGLEVNKPVECSLTIPDRAEIIRR